MHRFGIQLRNVIGHNESLTSPYHHERVRLPGAARPTATGRHADMEIYRRRLAALARRYAVPLGPAATPVTPRC